MHSWHFKQEREMPLQGSKWHLECEERIFTFSNVHNDFRRQDKYLEINKPNFRGFKNIY